MFIKPSLVRGTAANSAVRVGLLGCGGRGMEDATNLVDTGGARVVALGDLLQDQLDAARKHFDDMQQGKGYAALEASQLFVGPDAYHRIVASKEVDAIVIATPPYYQTLSTWRQSSLQGSMFISRSLSLLTFQGALKVIEIGKRAENKLCLDVGFQIRDCPPFCGTCESHSQWGSRQHCLRRGPLPDWLHR